MNDTQPNPKAAADEPHTRRVFKEDRNRMEADTQPNPTAEEQERKKQCLYCSKPIGGDAYFRNDQDSAVYHARCTQPNPKTSEWTAEWLETLFEKNFKGDTVKAILDAHSAALADAKAEWISTSNYGAILRENKELREQLVAERKQYAAWCIEKDQQLDAEREAKESAEANCDLLATEKHRIHREMKQLREQLTAAASALKFIQEVCTSPTVKENCKTALDKISEKKDCAMFDAMNNWERDAQ